jgi:O-antigen/teichoic acid export membrane protein
MNLFSRSLLERLGWTGTSYAFGQALRLVTNVALARLLAPEAFGIMVIVTTLRTGMELLSDIGIGQNIVVSKDSRDPDFYNTAWTVQIVRGLILCGLFVLAARPLAEFYGNPDLAQILVAMSSLFVIDGLRSVNRFLLQKDVDVRTTSIFEFVMSVVSTIIHIAFAVYNPTVWALVLGNIVSALISLIAGFFIYRKMTYRLTISRPYLSQIVNMGKWIFVSTLLFFFATSLDRLYLGRHISLELLGLYGVARSMSEVVVALVGRVNALIVFPMVAASGQSGAELRARLARGRFAVLAATAVATSVFTASSDLIIKVLYDDRYLAAAVILPILSFSVWFSILGTLGESILLGTGKPAPGAVANGTKLTWLLIGLPLGVPAYGLAGAIVVIASAELVRYVPIAVAMRRCGIGFTRQDAALTLLMVTLVLAWRGLAWLLGIAGPPLALFDLGRL